MRGTDTQTQTQKTFASSILNFYKVVSEFKNKHKISTTHQNRTKRQKKEKKKTNHNY